MAATADALRVDPCRRARWQRGSQPCTWRDDLAYLSLSVSESAFHFQKSLLARTVTQVFRCG